jgi:hypothetical protein
VTWRAISGRPYRVGSSAWLSSIRRDPADQESFADSFGEPVSPPHGGTTTRKPRGSTVTTGKLDIVPDDELPGASSHVFEMLAGVMHVYEKKRASGSSAASSAAAAADRMRTKVAEANKQDDEEVEEDVEEEEEERVLRFYPPVSANEFFHDMHAILRAGWMLLATS